MLATMLRKKARALIAIVILIAGFSLVQCSSQEANDQNKGNSAKQEEKATVEYEPVPALDTDAFVGDLSFKVNKQWRQEDGKENYKFCYPRADNKIMIMTYDSELDFSRTDFPRIPTEADFDDLFAYFIKGIGGTVLSQNKSENKSLSKYPAYDAELSLELNDTPYRLRAAVLLRSDASLISVIYFWAPETEYERWQKVIDKVMLSITPTESYVAEEVVRAEAAKVAAEEAAKAKAEEDAKKAAEAEAKKAAEQAEKDRIANQTVSQKNAVQKAKDYLKIMAFSKKGLIEQLVYEKFSYEDAAYGVEYCGANWMEQAEKKAKSYLKIMPFSKQGLIDQLLYEGFTYEEAVYGVDRCGANWMEQAEKKAQSYLQIMSFSRDGLIDQLLYEGFTYEEAVHGVNKVGL